jgi:hypothetical protein
MPCVFALADIAGQATQQILSFVTLHSQPPWDNKCSGQPASHSTHQHLGLWVLASCVLLTLLFLWSVGALFLWWWQGGSSAALALCLPVHLLRGFDLQSNATLCRGR